MTSTQKPPPDRNDDAAAQPPSDEFALTPGPESTDAGEAPADGPSTLELMPDGTPRGVSMDELAVAQPDNYLWKMMLWNEPRLALALLHQPRIVIGWFTRWLVRCLAAVRLRNHAAGLLRRSRRRGQMGLDLHGAKLELVPVLMPGARGHELSPDVTIRITWPRRWWQFWRRPREELLNLEFAKELAVGDDTEQLWSYFSRHRDREGPGLWLRQELIITGPAPDDPSRGRRSVVLCENYNGLKLQVPVNYKDECSAARIPAAARDTEFGGMGVLQFPDGRRPEDIAKAARQWYSNRQQSESSEGKRFVITFLDSLPEIYATFVEEVEKMRRGEVMADGRKPSRAFSDEAALEAINSFLGTFELEQVPLVRAELERSHQEGHELGRRETHVDALLAVLGGRKIRLSSAQKARLESLGCAELPAMQVALDAEDADDFARRAGL